MLYNNAGVATYELYAVAEFNTEAQMLFSSAQDNLIT